MPNTWIVSIGMRLSGCCVSFPLSFFLLVLVRGFVVVLRLGRVVCLPRPAGLLLTCCCGVSFAALACCCVVPSSTSLRCAFCFGCEVDVGGAFSVRTCCSVAVLGGARVRFDRWSPRVFVVVGGGGAVGGAFTFCIGASSSSGVVSSRQRLFNFGDEVPWVLAPLVRKLSLAVFCEPSSSLCAAHRVRLRVVDGDGVAASAVMVVGGIGCGNGFAVAFGLVAILVCCATTLAAILDAVVVSVLLDEPRFCFAGSLSLDTRRGTRLAAAVLATVVGFAFPTALGVGCVVAVFVFLCGAA